LKGSNTVVWETEGNYEPIAVGLINDTIPYTIGTSNSVLIDVYPQSQLAQERVNQYNLALTYAILVLTALGIVTTVRELWKDEQSTPLPRGIPDKPNPEARKTSDDNGRSHGIGDERKPEETRSEDQQAAAPKDEGNPRPSGGAPTTLEQPERNNR
jgi:hypothetical protein